jgi:TonB family protein
MKVNFTLILILVCMLMACEKKPSTQQGTKVDSLEQVPTDSLDTVGVDKNLNFYTNEDGERIYTEVANKAVFPDGATGLKKYLSENLIYPESSVTDGSEGIVTVAFVVDKTGKVGQVEILNAVEDDLLNEEALRVVEDMPQWEPGNIDGNPVNIRYILPVSFALAQ